MATAAGLPSRERGTARTPAARSTVEKGARRGHRPGPARTPRGARRRSSAGVGDRRGRGGRRLRRPRERGTARRESIARRGSPAARPTWRPASIERWAGRRVHRPEKRSQARRARRRRSSRRHSSLGSQSGHAPHVAQWGRSAAEATLAGQAAAFAAGERSAKNAAFAGHSPGTRPTWRPASINRREGATVAGPIAAPALPGKVRAGADEGLT